MSFRNERHDLLERTVREFSKRRYDSDTKEALASMMPGALKLYRSINTSEYNLVDRTIADVALSATRLSSQSFGQSWIAHSALKMLGLDMVLDTSMVYSERVSEFTRVARLFHKQQEEYDKHYDAGVDIAWGYSDDTKLGTFSLVPVKAYASLKTWGDEEKLVAMGELLEEYSRMKWELVVQGPITLLLKIGPEGFLAIWRALSWCGTREEPRLNDAKTTADAMFKELQCQDSEGFVKEANELVRAVISSYGAKWMIEQYDLRSLVPNKDRFFEAFDRGAFFKRAESAQEAV